ncbi:MAG: class I SAM-dependent methyltransferase [Fibrobacteraceae bacterium]|nr:class I SAM-dependent methyltransferase [Fibrobacteraceae bacterium]
MGFLQGQSSFFQPGPPAKPGEAYLPLVQFLIQEIRGKTVLDLGGGKGAYSLELKKAGYDVIVADINADSLKVASDLGLRTLNLDENKTLGENVADTVILIEVLEHVSDPRAFLQNAMSAARKRVLFSLPCTEDFKSLFNEGLTFAHIAVSDHLWHFSYQEMKGLLDSFHVPYQLRMGDFLFPRAPMILFRKRYRGPLGYLAMLPLRLLNKLKLIPKSIPSRFYGIIEKP